MTTAAAESTPTTTKSIALKLNFKMYSERAGFYPSTFYKYHKQYYRSGWK